MFIHGVLTRTQKVDSTSPKLQIHRFRWQDLKTFNTKCVHTWMMPHCWERLQHFATLATWWKYCATFSLERNFHRFTSSIRDTASVERDRGRSWCQVMSQSIKRFKFLSDICWFLKEKLTKKGNLGKSVNFFVWGKGGRTIQQHLGCSHFDQIGRCATAVTAEWWVKTKGSTLSRIQLVAYPWPWQLSSYCAFAHQTGFSWTPCLILIGRDSCLMVHETGFSFFCGRLVWFLLQIRLVDFRSLLWYLSKAPCESQVVTQMWGFH